MTTEIKSKNLRRLCGLNGMTVEDLCSRVRRHKTTVYRAVRHPKLYGPTFALISQALPIREVKRA